MLSTQPDPHPPLLYTLYEYIPLYLFTQGKRGGGVGEPLRRLENAYMPDDWLYLQSIDSFKHQ
jgi:hypothetical protein